MAIIIQDIKVNVSQPNFFPAIVAKQYDSNSRFLRATLIHNNEKIEIQSTSTVMINATRDDGEDKTFAGVVNADGTVTVPLTTWMLELAGTVIADISVVDIESRKLTTTTFVIQVEKASCDNDDIAEDENYDILVQLIEEVNAIKDDYEQASALLGGAE